MRRTLLVFLALFGAGIVLVSVMFSRTSQERADFTYVSGAEPKSLDPAIMTGQLEGRFAEAMFEGLTYWDPETLDPVPGMAERWETSLDEKVWTFHLRRDARWSNGEPVTARDFHWSWRRALSPELASEYSYMLWDIVGAEDFNKGSLTEFDRVGITVLDDATLRVTLKSAVPYFLDLTSFYTLSPVHRPTIERWEADPNAPPGAWTLPGRVVVNGPYLLESWVTNDRIRLRRNPGYWNAGAIRLETIDALSIEDNTAALNAFLTHEADWNPANWANSLNDEVRKLPEFVSTEAFISYYYRINNTRAHFRDRRVRQAFSMAVDRTELVENITRLGEKEAYTYVPPGIKGYDPPPGLRHDPDRARKLLAEAGFPGGRGFPPIEILYNTHEGHRQIATVIARQLSETLGIQVHPHNQEWQSYQSDTQTLKYDLARAGWIGDYLDPNTFLDMWVTGGGNNQTGYASPLYDQLHRISKDISSFVQAPEESLYGQLVEGEELRRRVAAAGAVPEMEVAERLRLQKPVRMLVFREMEQLLCEIDCPIIPLYTYVTKNLVSRRVGGFHGWLRGPAGERLPNVRDLHPLRGFFVLPRPPGGA